MFDGGSVRDPFSLLRTDRDNFPSQSDPRGRVQRAVPTGAGIGVFICAGQSNISSWAEGAYAATSANIDNLNIWDGGVYAASDPTLGSDGAMSNWTRRFADKLIVAEKYSRVVLVPCGMGSSSSADWTPTAQYYQRLTASFERCKAINLKVTAVLWQQGEAAGDTSTAAYVGNLSAIIGGVRSLGFNAPWLLGKSTWTTSGTKSAIRAAIDQLVAAVPNIFLGGDTDDLTGSFRQASPSPHFSATGAEQCAIRWRDAFLATGI